MSDLSATRITEANATVPLSSAPAPRKLSMVALRERKKDQTRDALARAAFELFQQKGYEATTVAEIARAANVSRRTFFRYYATKDALLFVEDDDHITRFRELLDDRRPGDSDFAPVRRACLGLATEFMRDREQVIARARIIDASPALSKQERQQDMLWEQAIAEALLDAVSEPSEAASRRARVFAGAVFGAIRAAMSEWYRDGGRRDLVALAREGLALFEGASSLRVAPEAKPRAVAN